MLLLNLLTVTLRLRTFARKLRTPTPTTSSLQPAVWDVVPGDQVAAVVVACAAATSARVHIDGYEAAVDSVAAGSAVIGYGSGGSAGGVMGGSMGEAAAVGPLVVHAATSTTYPISFGESQW